MEKVVRSSKSVTYTILDGIVSTAVLIISVAASRSIVDEEPSPYMFMILFFALTGMRVVQAALNKDKGKKGVLRLLIGAGIYGIISLILLIWGINDTVTLVIMVIYLLDVVVGRVFAIIQGKRLIGRIFNGIICALIIFISLSTLTMEEGQENSILLILLVVIVVRSLLHIIALSFSQIKLDVLMKIIRRTYALEILFGLLMLIATFSYVFTFLEDSIIDYWDGLWYCFAIVTTIGFGDISAVTITGRVLSVILGIYGIIVVSMVTSIIINFYGEMKDMQEEEHRKELEQQAKKKKKKKAKVVIEKSEEETEEETEEESEENEVEDSEEDTEEESGGEGED